MTAQFVESANYEVFEKSGKLMGEKKNTLNEPQNLQQQEWIIKCYQCKRSIRRREVLRESIMYCLGRIWHREHFKCVRCDCSIGIDGRAFRKCSWNRNLPICLDCHMEEHHPKCFACTKTLRETCVKALEKLWHHSCFVCTKCQSPFEGGEYYLLAGQPYDDECYHLLKFDNHLARKNDVQPQQEPKPPQEEGISEGPKVEVTDEMKKTMEKFLEGLDQIQSKNDNGTQNADNKAVKAETVTTEKHSTTSTSKDSELTKTTSSPITEAAAVVLPFKPATNLKDDSMKQNNKAVDESENPQAQTAAIQLQMSSTIDKATSDLVLKQKTVPSSSQETMTTSEYKTI